MADTFTPKTATGSQFAWSTIADWSTGALPDQNTAATLSSNPAGYTVLVDGNYTVNQLTFGSGAGALSMQLAKGDSITSGSLAQVVAGTTMTINAASLGTFTTNGMEVQTGATFTMLGGTFSSPNSGLTLDNGASATFGTGVTLNVNTLNLNGSAKLTLNVGTAGAPHVISNVNDTTASSTLIVAGGNLQLGSGGGGTYVVSNKGEIEFTGSLGSNATIDLAGGLAQFDNNTNLQSGTSFAFSGTTASTFDIVSNNNFQNGFAYAVTGFDYGDKMQFGSLSLTGDTAVYSGTTLTIKNGTTQVLQLTNLALAADAASVHSFTLSGNTITLACFLSGTRIETAGGAVPVELLQVGHQLVTIRDGLRVLQPICWIGSRHIDAADLNDDEDAYPVRIKAGAFASGLPRHDLLVTGDHCIFVDGGLIPARMLVNGRSIVRDTTIARYTVHHVELAAHSIMLAEGLPVESYLDTGNRASFGPPGSKRARPDLDQPSSETKRDEMSWSIDAAAPLTIDRETVEPIWRALVHRANLLGTLPIAASDMSEDPRLELLLDGGDVLLPHWRSGERHLFRVPTGARPLRLQSRSARPSEIVGPFVNDRRKLGVRVCRISLWNGLIEKVLTAAELDGAGWHSLEDGSRWTNGDADLPVFATDTLDNFLDIQLTSLEHYPALPNGDRHPT